MRLYYGTYGHHLSGKLYVYWGDDNLRTGQQVVAPVTNPKSGKNYNTMFTIARAQSPKNAQGEVNRLGEQGIFIKTIPGRDIMSLPGAAPFKTKAEWKRDSDRRYRQKFGLPEPDKNVERAARSTSGNKNSARTSSGRKSSSGKKGKSKAEKAVRAAARLLSGVADRTDAKAMARKNLMGRKTAADSFYARERMKKIKQRDAFIED